MIQIIVQLLNGINLGQSEVIDIAKGMNQYPKTIKEAYKKTKTKWQEKQR